MTRTPRLAAVMWMRILAVLQIFLLVLAPGCVHPGALDPQPGVLEYRAPLRIALPGATVDVAGGNLVVRRIDLSLDTRVTTLEIGAVYNAASRSWLWSFDVWYDGATFVDATGAVHDMTAVSPGEAVPGTHWVKIDARHVKTKGGLVHAFDPSTHRLDRVSWGVGTRPELVYDVAIVSGVVRVVEVSQCDALGVCQLVHDVAYDGNGCVSSVADRAGRVADFVNAQCRPLVARDGLDVAEDWPGRRYTYDAGLLTSQTTSEGERTVYAYLDGRIALVRQIGEIGEPARITRFDYGMDAQSGLFYTRVRDIRGGESVYRYDGEGRLHGVVDAAGDEATYTWDGRRPASWTDPAGATTTWAYVGDDPVAVALPSGNALSFAWASDAHDRSRPFARPLLRASDDLGLIEERTYDAAGRLQSIENGAGELTGYAYGADESVSMVSLPDGTITWLEEYGEHGHPTRVLRSTYTDFREYDAVGNQIIGADIRDPLSPGRPGIRRLVFDEDRQVRSIELVGSDTLGELPGAVHSVEIERRSDGRAVRVTRPFGGEVEYGYDGFGDLVERRERVDGVWRSTLLERDVAGELVAVELANGMRRETKRDVLGRVVDVTLVDEGVALQTMQESFAAGRLVERLDSLHGSPERFFYDAAGRLDRIVHPGGEVTELGYDLRSREVSRVYRMADGAPALRTLERSYDDANREVELRDDGVPVLTRQIGGGRVDEVAYGNGLVRRFEYEATAGLLTGTRLEPAAGGMWVEETRIAWASCAPQSLCVTTRTDLPGDPAGLPALLTYEGYRLGPLPTVATGLGAPGLRLEAYLPDDQPSSLEPPSPEYVFDALGNWLGVVENGVAQLTLAFNAERNRLQSAAGAEAHVYTWDEAGFVTARDGEPYRFSPNGRPTAIGTRITLQWDVLGRPVSTTVDGVTTRLRFGGAVLADGAGVPRRIDLGEVVIDLGAGERFYRHDDFRGNVQLVTDSTGTPLLHHTYGPFGVAQTFGVYEDVRSFAGGAGLGDLVMLGARLYDPAVGRFLSPDPIDHPVNRFAYTLGNPVFLWDPGGRQAEAVENRVADVSDSAGQVLASIGITLLAVGASQGNIPLAAFGAALITVGHLLQLQAKWARACDGCRVEIYEVSFDELSPPRRTAAVEATEVADPGCAPTSITASGHAAWPSLLLVALQVVAALALTARLERTRRR